MISRALVVGGDARLGAALLTALAAPGISEHHPIATSRRPSHASEQGWFPLDLSDNDLRLPTWSDVVYLVAAVTKVVDCDAHPQATWRVNADAPVTLALQAHREARHVIFISSDAVEKAPAMNYSRQKAYAESMVLGMGGTVVRPSRIPPDASKLVELLVMLGKMQTPGLVRWSP